METLVGLADIAHRLQRQQAAPRCRGAETHAASHVAQRHLGMFGIEASRMSRPLAKLRQTKRTEVAALGRAAARVDHVDQRRPSEHVGEKDELLPLRRGDLAAVVEERQHTHPLLVGEVGLARVDRTLKVGDIFRGSLPFLLAMIVSLIILAIFPQISTWLARL